MIYVHRDVDCNLKELWMSLHEEIHVTMELANVFCDSDNSQSHYIIYS